MEHAATDYSVVSLSSLLLFSISLAKSSRVLPLSISPSMRTSISDLFCDTKPTKCEILFHFLDSICLWLSIPESASYLVSPLDAAKKRPILSSERKGYALRFCVHHLFAHWVKSVVCCNASLYRNALSPLQLNHNIFVKKHIECAL